ncbi:MAG: hypothetical protein A2Z25_09955 [Planctomycetes bacterium RBG_16_55_9]|nr:MAG: hypothetical protein A2Z25_09955 [Planctomycetes bacterium RBG_16_55_9]
MFDRVLNRVRDSVRQRRYIMTYHARREMLHDDLTIYDIERGILTGNIIERQKDRTTGEWKYRIAGKAIEGGEVEVAAKLNPNGKLVIITVYAR